MKCLNRKIRHESSRRFTWHHWGNHQLDPQYGERGNGLGIAKSMGVGHRCERVTLYIHDHENSNVVSIMEMTFSLPSTTRLL